LRRLAVLPAVGAFLGSLLDSGFEASTAAPDYSDAIFVTVYEDCGSLRRENGVGMDGMDTTGEIVPREMIVTRGCLPDIQG
jgi:hypothetical protein